MTGPRISADLQALAEAWHRLFGKVKCHLVDCPVCRDTDWPVASWVSRDPEPTSETPPPPAQPGA